MQKRLFGIAGAGGLLVLVTAAGCATGGGGTAPVPEAARTRIVTRSVGNIEVNLIAETMGEGRGRPPRFVNAEDSVIRQYIPDGAVESEVNMFAVKTPEGTIVIDTGLGAGIQEGLQRLRVDPAEVAAVLLTHTHFDHTAGLLKDGQAAFPNARLYLSEKELDFWNANNGADFTAAYEVTTFAPEALESAAAGVLFACVTPVAAYGHTPGHTAYMIESEGQKLLIAGDVINVQAVQFPRPDICAVFDGDADAASGTRKRILEYASENAVSFTGMHLLFPAIGSVTRDGQGFAFTAR